MNGIGPISTSKKSPGEIKWSNVRIGRTAALSWAHRVRSSTCDDGGEKGWPRSVAWKLSFLFPHLTRVLPGL